MKTELKNHLLLALRAKQKNGSTQFYLIGIVPAKIVWENGQTEEVELRSMVAVAPWSEGKRLLAEVVPLKEFRDRIGTDLVDALIERMTEDIATLQVANKLGDKKFTALTIG